MVKFIWSSIAKEEYWKNIDYLLESWTEKEASKFVKAVSKALNIIDHNPQAFPQTEYKNIRFAVITPQITLFYNIVDKKRIELLRFWNNFQSPQNLHL